MAETDTIETYTIKEALAEKVGENIEIAIEAADGTRLKLQGTAEQLDTLVGELETILEADDAEAEDAGDEDA